MKHAKAARVVSFYFSAEIHLIGIRYIFVIAKPKHCSECLKKMVSPFQFLFVSVVRAIPMFSGESTYDAAPKRIASPGMP